MPTVAVLPNEIEEYWTDSTVQGDLLEIVKVVVRRYGPHFRPDICQPFEAGPTGENTVLGMKRPRSPSAIQSCEAKYEKTNTSRRFSF